MQTIRQVSGRGLLVRGFEELAVAGAVVGPTLPNFAAAEAYVQFGGDPVRFRFDGTDPSPTSGFVGWDHDSLLLSRDEFLKIRFIQDSTATQSSVVRIAYYG